MHLMLVYKKFSEPYSLPFWLLMKPFKWKWTSSDITSLWSNPFSVLANCLKQQKLFIFGDLLFLILVPAESYMGRDIIPSKCTSVIQRKCLNLKHFQVDVPISSTILSPKYLIVSSFLINHGCPESYLLKMLNITLDGCWPWGIISDIKMVVVCFMWPKWKYCLQNKMVQYLS